MSSIVYATVIIVLVLVPLFALSGIEGRLFAPLGAAFIVSILASMLVSVTLTPVLCYYLLARGAAAPAGDDAKTPWWSLRFNLRAKEEYSPLVRKLKAWDARILYWSFDRAKPLLAAALAAVLLAAAAVPFFPRSFLPPFNEGTLTINLLLNPGTSLGESNRAGSHPRRAAHRARRAGRARRGRALHRDRRRSETLRAQP
jgi:HME family heavy-metal exporter